MIRLPAAPDVLALRGRVRAALAVLVAVTAFVLAPLDSARAHSGLADSDPKDGARLAAPPAEITLVFSEAVRPEFTAVRLSVGSRAAVPLQSRVDGAQVRATVPKGSESTDGAWRVAYRVVSADGHPVGGSVGFTVAAPVAPPKSSVPRVGASAEGGSAATAGPVTPSAEAVGTPRASATALPSVGAQGVSPPSAGDASPLGVVAWSGAAAALVVAASIVLLRGARRRKGTG